MTITDSCRAAPVTCDPLGCNCPCGRCAERVSTRGVEAAPAGDTYALYRTSDMHPAGHATSLTGAVAALAALLGRPAEGLHTEQPAAFGGWLVKDAAGATVGAIALVARRVPGAVRYTDGIESGAAPSSAP